MQKNFGSFEKSLVIFSPLLILVSPFKATTKANPATNNIPNSQTSRPITIIFYIAICNCCLW